MTRISRCGYKPEGKKSDKKLRQHDTRAPKPLVIEPAKLSSLSRTRHVTSRCLMFPFVDRWTTASAEMSGGQTCLGTSNVDHSGPRAATEENRDRFSSGPKPFRETRLLVPSNAKWRFFLLQVDILQRHCMSLLLRRQRHTQIEKDPSGR